METVSHCPVCNSSALDLYLVCNDYLVSNQEFTIQQCEQCGFRLTNPRPDAASIGAYYKSNQYVSHNDAGGGVVNTAYRMVRNYTLRLKLKLINKLNNGTGKILDVGCGTGAFLETCQRGGWQVVGTEPDDGARAISARKLNADIKPDLESCQQSGQFDVITLWHVLEHIPNLNATILQLHKLLTENGALVIAVPNSDSFDAQTFQQYWAAYDVPRHLHHFVPATIEPLLKKYGFKLVEQRPMVFDAFYISMLSTRYKTGKTDYLKSVWVGVVSNTKSHRTGNSSSQIYIFKKAH